MDWKHIALFFASVIALFFLLRIASCTARYSVRQITTNMDERPNIFKADTSLECVPGPGPKADYYTKENSEGMCGLQNYVHDLGHEYIIRNGIGGSLLSD